MILKDLRSVIDEQTTVDVVVESAENSVESGKLWFFSVDQSIDNLEVKQITPKDDYLIITLSSSPERLRDTDWDSVFNQQTVTSFVTDQTDIIGN